MKKMNYLLGLLVVAALSFTFTSCDDTKDAGPTIDLFGGDYIDADATVAAGSTMLFKVNCTAGDKNLEEFFVIEGNANVTGYPEEITTGDSFQKEISLTAPTTVGDVIYTFKVVDKNDNFDEVSVTITVEASGTAFATEVTSGKVYHFLAPEMASWNLVADAAISSSSADDIIYIQNNDEAGAYIGKFQSKNSTGFVKVTLDYATATKEEATAAYTGSSTTIDAPAANDVYVAMKGTELYLIKITDINTTDGASTAGNTGSMSFSYKK